MSCAYYCQLIIYYIFARCSSISSGLNALAIVILEDIVKLIWDWRDIHPSPVITARLAKVIGKNNNAGSEE